MWGSFLRTLNLFKVTWLLSRSVLLFGYLPSIYLLLSSTTQDITGWLRSICGRGNAWLEECYS